MAQLSVIAQAVLPPRQVSSTAMASRAPATIVAWWRDALGPGMLESVTGPVVRREHVHALAPSAVRRSIHPMPPGGG
jgi:hypothetical protein